MKIILTAEEWSKVKDSLNSAKSLLAEAGQLLDRQDFAEMVHQWHERACGIANLDRDFHDDFEAQKTYPRT